jgi:hypothetical protein
MMYRRDDFDEMAKTRDLPAEPSVIHATSSHDARMEEAALRHRPTFYIETDFDAIFDRVWAKGIPYGSGPFTHSDGKINRLVYGRMRIYFGAGKVRGRCIGYGLCIENSDFCSSY